MPRRKQHTFGDTLDEVLKEARASLKLVGPVPGVPDSPVKGPKRAYKVTISISVDFDLVLELERVSSEAGWSKSALYVVLLKLGLKEWRRAEEQKKRSSMAENAE